MNRRQFFRNAAIAGGVTLFPWAFLGRQGAWANTQDFINPLPIPPLLAGRKTGTQRTFDLTLQHGQSQFLVGTKTATLGINGNYLGPVLRARSGEQIRIHVYNQMNEPSTLHWHGLRIPGEADGGPHESIPPQGVWQPTFTLTQPASTQWYHSHAFHRTGAQVYHGLAGLFYIDDEHADDLQLPKDYGIDDIPLVLQDRSFNADGSLRYANNMHQSMAGMLGNVLLVNGMPTTQLKAQRRLIRLRILNGSNARIYNLRFADRRVFQQIASDGGLLASPTRMRTLLIAPGERAEILVEIAPQEDVMLEHAPIDLGSGGMMMSMSAGADDGPYNVLRITATHDDRAKAPIPMHLTDIPAMDMSAASKQRNFLLGMRMMRGSFINGRQMDMQRIDHRVKLGATEVWTFKNDSPMPHPMHIHGTQFRVIARSSGEVPLNQRGYKDTVLVLPDEQVKVVAQFAQAANERKPFMFHCHNLEHEDGGMMGQFTVEA